MRESRFKKLVVVRLLYPRWVGSVTASGQQTKVVRHATLQQIKLATSNAHSNALGFLRNFCWQRHVRKTLEFNSRSTIEHVSTVQAKTSRFQIKSPSTPGGAPLESGACWLQ